MEKEHIEEMVCVETRERLMLSGIEKKFSNSGIESRGKSVSGDTAKLCKPV